MQALKFILYKDPLTNIVTIVTYALKENMQFAAMSIISFLGLNWA